MCRGSVSITPRGTTNLPHGCPGHHGHGPVDGRVQVLVRVRDELLERRGPRRAGLVALPAHRQRRVDGEEDEEGPPREGVQDRLGRDRRDDPARPPRLCDKVQEGVYVVKRVGRL